MTVELTEVTLQEAFDNNEKFLQTKSQIVQDISKGKYDISIFVERLGFALTSTVVDERVKGTRFLSEVLSQLPIDLLNSIQLEFLTTFYADRLNDNHNVIPAVIDGIQALILMKHLPRQSVPRLLESFFQHTTCQSQVRNDRAKVFNIFRYLTENYAPELKAMSGTFIYGLLNSIEGERDPRNLDFIFSFMPNVIENFPLLHLSEEMFEIFACYFPIDFNPSKNDPDTITREKLAKKLANCLVANDFVEWLVPLALEKLESDWTDAKLDSLDLLNLCALKLPAKLLESYFEQIWNGIKSEIFPGSDKDEIVTSGLKTLRSLLENAGQVSDVSHHHQTLVLSVILPHLSDVQQRLFEPASAIALVCIAGDPQFASERIFSCFLLKLEVLDKESHTTNGEQRMKIFMKMEQALQIISSKKALDKVNTDTLNQIQANAITCLRCENETDMEKENSMELKTAAINMLNECVPIVNESNRVLLYRGLVQLINDEKLDFDLTNLLSGLGSLHPIELQSNCINSWIRNFPIFSNFVQKKIYKNLLPLVLQMAFTQSILDLIMSNIFYSEGQKIENENGIILAIGALNDLLRTEDKRFIEELQSNSSLIDKLIQLTKKQLFSIEVLNEISSALSLIVQNLPVSEQYMIISEYLPVLNLSQQTDLFIAKGLLGFLHKDIRLDDHFNSLLNSLVRLSMESDDERISKVAHHLLCNLVNKVDFNETNKSLISEALIKLNGELQNCNCKVLETLAWMAKGLIARGVTESDAIVEKLVELLEHATLAKTASLAFETISTEYPDLYLPNATLLFKQKFFYKILSKLGNDLQHYNEHHLIAFMYVLRSIPHAVIKMNIEKVGPVLFKCLDSSNVQTLCISLEIVETFVKHRYEYFRNHLSHIIPSCLQLSRFSQSMQVRITALNVLHEITNYPSYVLLPLKSNVVFELVPALDDPKRLVRMAAVKARNAWFFVAAQDQ